MELHKLEEAKIRKLNKLLKEGSITELQFKTASNFVREYYQSKSCKLKENKTNQLEALYLNGNITDEQFAVADEFFKKYSTYEKEVDWNKGLKITWDDLEKVIKKERNSKSQAKKKIRKGLEGFKEGEDYIILNKGTYKGEPWTAYQPFTWEASRMIASHYVEPTRGYEKVLDAEWCTAYQKDRDFWDSHIKNEAFIYLCGETIPTSKVSICISKKKEDADDTEFIYNTGTLNYNIWDFENFNDSVDDEDLLDIVPNLYDIIEKAYDNWEKNKPQLIYNPKTNRYDFEGDLPRDILRKYIKSNRDGFTINFGVIKGDFDCSGFDLYSLKGSPQRVGGSFYCCLNRLSSLEGATQRVGGTFNCYHNRLTSLEGAPQTITENFYCSMNNLTSLKGAPQKVGGNFDCSRNPNLHSLEGIGEVKGNIYKDF